MSSNLSAVRAGVWPLGLCLALLLPSAALAQASAPAAQSTVAPAAPAEPAVAPPAVAPPPSPEAPLPAGGLAQPNGADQTPFAQPPAAAPPMVPDGAPPPSPTAQPMLANPKREWPQFFAGYELGVPTASLRDFVSKTSFRGFDMGASWPIVGALQLGFAFSLHTFSEDRGNDTYQLKNGALNAALYAYARVWTTTGVVRYHFLPADAIVRPYAGLRMGISFAAAAILIADLSVHDDPVGFALSPEAGIQVRIAPVASLTLSVRYDFSTASSGPLDNISFFPIQLGASFHSRK